MTVDDGEKRQDLASDYGWRDGGRPRECDPLGRRIGEIVAGLGGGDVLDIGCGDGCFCGHLAAAGHRVTGVDADEQAIALARQYWPQAVFHRMSIESALPVDMRGGFDVVVSSQVIEHLYRPSLLLKMAALALKPSGHLVLSTPYHGYLKDVVLAALGRWDRHHDSLREGGHIKFWSPATLTGVLRHHGFVVTRWEGHGLLPLLWMSQIVTAAREP